MCAGCGNSAILSGRQHCATARDCVVKFSSRKPLNFYATKHTSLLFRYAIANNIVDHNYVPLVK